MWAARRGGAESIPPVWVPGAASLYLQQFVAMLSIFWPIPRQREYRGTFLCLLQEVMPEEAL